ncbi:hypothetical protein DFJ74DRAFT_673932 [Hyaloraphidium curvatum]|nr:hypothetical protein DFJ74DRAFT_673932 [Hyaloraphidium curvatum]
MNAKGGNIVLEATTDHVFQSSSRGEATGAQRNYLPPMPLDHVADMPPFPEYVAGGLEEQQEGFRFDFGRHIDFQPPAFVYDLDFNRVAYEDIPKVKDTWSGFGFSTPFKLLSAEGVARFKEIIGRDAASRPFAVHREELFPASLRGLGYTSRFARDSVRSPDVLGILGNLAGDVVAPDSIPLNYMHTNLGLPPAPGAPARSAAAWHSDSVQYVLVIMLCDTSQMVGGELEVVAVGKDKAREDVEMNDEAIAKLPADKIIKVKYPGEGWCIFMQGARFYHQVAPVISCHPDHPRLSVVNSYQSLRLASAPDYSIGEYYGRVDPPWLSYREYLMHCAWRSNEILKLAYNGPKPAPLGTSAGLGRAMSSWLADAEKDRDDAMQLLDRAIGELEKCREVLRKTRPTGFVPPFVEEGGEERLRGNPYEYLLGKSGKEEGKAPMRGRI